MTIDLSLVVRDYLEMRFPDQIGVSVGDWIYVWSKDRSFGPSYIAQIQGSNIIPFWNPLSAIWDGPILNAANPNFFENLEKLVKSYMKEERNG